MTYKLALVLAAVATASVVTFGQQPPPPAPQAPAVPQFRSTAEILRLDVSVLDRDRLPVRGLTMADFTVLENGTPQPLSAFAEVVVPDPIVPTTAWMRDVEPDIRRNDDLNERRLIVIVIDDAQIGSPNPRFASNVRAAARSIIDRLGPADLAAVIFTLDSRNMQEFTSDRTRLLAAIDRFQPGMGGSEDLFQRYSVGTLRRAAEYLSEIPQRRKAMFYISTGVPVDAAAVATLVRSGIQGVGGDAVGRNAWVMSEMQEVYKHAQLANVNIHAIDPSALDSLSGGRGRVEKDFLIAVSENTGGFPIINRDDYEDAVAQVFMENGSYYLLGYEPTRGPDGKFRRVDVRVNRPDLTVRARSGYYAPEAARPVRATGAANAGPSPLWKAISGLLPVGDLSLQVTAAPFAIAGKKEATVAIVLGIVQDVETGETRYVEKIDFLIDAFGQDGSSKTAHGLNAEVVLKPNVKGKVGYEVLSRIDLKPGRYQLRLSAHLPSQDKSGSIYYDIDVPDFTKGPLALSGAMLSVTPNIHAAPRDKLSDLMTIVPTTNRHFNRKTDQVWSFVRIYQPGRGSTKPIVLATRVTDSTGVAVMNTVRTVPAAAFGPGRVVPWRAAVPIATLEPGVYLLTFEASIGTSSARRDVRFVVK
jgi:VWFA-related protein